MPPVAIETAPLLQITMCSLQRQILFFCPDTRLFFYCLSKGPSVCAAACTTQVKVKGT